MDKMTTAVRRVLSNYATFSGRASRPEFWWWALAVFLVMLVLSLIDAFIIAPMLGFQADDDSAGQPLSFLVSLAIIIPNLAVGARRLHDSGRTAWWLLIGLVPVLGFLVLLYFYIQPSDPGPNEHGPPQPLIA